MQPYIYVPSLDVLLRTKEPVIYRQDSGRPEALGCLLLYFMLRHNYMINIDNIKDSCDLVTRDARCGWKQAVENLDIGERRIRLQGWSNIPKSPCPSKNENEEEMKRIEEKFGSICKSFYERVLEKK